MSQGHSTQRLRAIVRHMLNATTIQSDIVVAGGVVPWLISGRDAGRLHTDLDVVAPMAAMPEFRAYVQRHGWYVPACDSLALPQNTAQHDYGLIANVDGVSLNIAPFVQHGTDIIQFNCTFAVHDARDALLTVTLPHIVTTQYVHDDVLPTGELLGHYPLALVKATKLITNRPKDHHDIAEIDRIGVESDQVAWYAQMLAQMHIAMHEC